MRAFLILLVACGAQSPPDNDIPEDTNAALDTSTDVATDSPVDAAEIDAAEIDAAELDAAEVDAAGAGPLADVVAVAVQGDGLAVTLRSPDTGCEQYANWWEVVSEDGALLYRRILGHSHVDEQPFTRSGSPVTSDATIIVRAHMAPGGYGGVAFRGTLAGGFSAAPDIGADFAAGLAEEAPLPTSCAF